MSPPSNYDYATERGIDEVPDFLVSSVPHADSNDKEISNISKDSINPFPLAESMRKFSAESSRSANRSNISDDNSRFSFEPTRSPSGLKPFDHFHSNETDLSIVDTSTGSHSFHTALSESFLTNPSYSSPSSIKKKELTIETSTPNKSLLENNSSMEQFSFLNTSDARKDSSLTSVSLDRATQRHMSATHSRNSSVSWRVQSPEEWTLERVLLWLETHQFNDSWAQTFQKHDLVGEKFLELSNYQNLQKFKNELETTNDSTQSRFIHLLRKTLDRASSVSTTNVLSPHSLNSSSSFESSVEDNQSEIKIHSRSASDTGASENLVLNTSGEKLIRPQTLAHRRLSRKASTQRRPFSTIENSTGSTWTSSPVSPAVPHGFFRRHTKSNSSESSLFTTLFTSSSSHLPQTQEEKRHSSSAESKGLLSKFRKRNGKSNSKDSKDLESSPISPISSNTDGISLRSHIGSKESSESLSNELPFLIDRRFHPLPQNNNSDKYVLVTTDNVSFRPINIGQCSNKEEFKQIVIETLLPNTTNVTIHLTDFGCSIGDALDEDTLDIIVKKNFGFISGKFLVTSTDTLSTLNSNSVTSTSDLQSFESKEDRLYPNTPLHYYESTTNNRSPPSVDYLNFKQFNPVETEETFGGSSPQPTTFSSSKESSSSRTEKTNGLPRPSLNSSNSSLSSSTQMSSKSLLRKPPAEKSFRVIRPTEKGEINFDKRRESPYTTKPTLVARRSAPPPPTLLSRPNLDTRSISRQDSKISTVPSLTPVRESVSNEGSYLSPYTPGSSNTLVPEPYKGNGSVSPASRKTFALLNNNNSIGSKPLSRNVSGTYSTHSGEDKFQENVISFENVPGLDDDDDGNSSGNSDDDFWAKTPSDIKQKDGSSTSISQMVVRPAPEVLYENLEKFFPNADLDQPVIDVDTPPNSPLNDKQTHAAVSKPVDTQAKLDNLLKPQRIKTIRVVAREAGEARKRESIKRNVHAHSSLVRRQSTKMWGRKVVEVKPNQKQYISKVRKGKRDDIKEFSWIKGELIGKGTFGNVYIALNVTTGEMIAVKQVTIPSGSHTNSKVVDIIDALRSEVETLKDLDHLNIVQYLGFERTEREYNLFLEYVAGGSVASCLRLHGRFEEPLIKFLTSQVISGLAYLHSRGILHRDMKADNLLLDLDGVCKISDFGISKKSNDIYENDAGMSMQGTIFWMAPEVVDSSGAGYSAKVDIWSLGCVVLEMFAGRRPWSNLEAIPAMLKIGKAKAAPPIPEDTLPFVSMEGRAFLDSCFTTDARRRPTARRLSESAFCSVDSTFKFSSTKLAGLIKANEKKVNI